MENVMKKPLTIDEVVEIVNILVVGGVPWLKI